MTREEINTACAALSCVRHVVQWGASDVWKVGDESAAKVFAVNGAQGVSFRASEIGFEALQLLEGVRPAPYMASRGMKWLQRLHGSEGLDGAELLDCLSHSHEIAAATLTKKHQRVLGLSRP